MMVHEKRIRTSFCGGRFGATSRGAKQPPRWPAACDAFERDPNGSWTVLRPATIGPNGVQPELAPGETFAKNQFLHGIEVTNVLDRNCGND